MNLPIIALVDCRCDGVLLTRPFGKGTLLETKVAQLRDGCGLDFIYTVGWKNGPEGSRSLPIPEDRWRLVDALPEFPEGAIVLMCSPLFPFFGSRAFMKLAAELRRNGLEEAHASLPFKGRALASLGERQCALSGDLALVPGAASAHRAGSVAQRRPLDSAARINFSALTLMGVHDAASFEAAEALWRHHAAA